MGTQVKRGVILCADDYGQSPGISRAIVRLAAAGRLTAISCLANGPTWRQDAEALHGLNDRVDIGIHFSLTELRPLGPMPRLAPDGVLPTIGRLTLAALVGAIDTVEIADELARQRDAFVQAFGRAPDFIDGHQHAHTLPRVRDVVLDLLRTGFLPRHAYIRSCWEPPIAVMRTGVAPAKALTLSALNFGFTRAARSRGLSVTSGFRGVHHFVAETPEQVEARFDRWFRDAPAGSLINCHPGEAEATPAMPDAIAATRVAELGFLASDRFPALLERHRVRLVRGVGRVPAGQSA